MIRVAIADDHPLLRAGIIDHIQGDNVKVVAQANDGKELLEKLKEVYGKGEAIDVVILDISMEPMNGTECLPIVRASYPEIKTIIMSNFKEHQVINEHWNLGASCYLLKTQGPANLVEAINEVNQKGFYVTDEMLPAIRNTSNPKKEVDTIQKRKEKLKINETELKMMELMFYKEYSSKMLAPELNMKDHKSVDNAKYNLYNKFRDAGEQIYGEIGLMRVAIQYGYVDIAKIGQETNK